MLAAILAISIRDDSEKQKENIVNNTALAAAKYLETGYKSSGDTVFEYYIVKQNVNIKNYLTMLANYTDDMIIFVSDINGSILITDTSVKEEEILTDVPEEIVENVLNGSNVRLTNDLDGVFQGNHLTFAVPIEFKGESIAIVFTSSDSPTFTMHVEKTIKTIIMASLWVLLATFIAVYFISERMIGPLKDMSKAAKSFAAGRFDVRIPIVGRDEVSELAVAFNTMADSLVKLENMRRDFIANVSHDLRTPMTTIARFIENILDGIIPPEKHNYYLNIIKEEVFRLSRLVNSLLDISKIQAGERKFNPVSFDICEMARIILFSFEQRIIDKKLEPEFECDNDNMFVYADEDAIHQVLYNLCDNAVKFSNPGGKYQININYKDKKVQVSVYNEGQGIPPEDLSLVFERFHKADKSRGLDKSGSGLGLYISKTIMDAHNEKIKVESEYGKWCRFEFSLTKAK